ncbi:MAG: MFS transporter [Proteobacteria bacterium]|nr:MFS transporter [Pseudomonadota bacterium]
MTPPTARDASWLHGVLTPFRTPLFTELWFASLASNFGTMFQTVGAAWLMTTLARSSDLVAFVQAATALPIMVLSVPAGAIADIWDRRALMLIAQVGMLLVAVLLTVLAFRGGLSPWALLGFTFLLGCGSAVNGPAWQSSVGEQVPAAQVPAAVALNSLGYNIARTVGPAVGGAIVAAGGAAIAFLCNAVSYLALIVVLGRWRRPTPPASLPPESIGAAIATGARYARLSPSIRTVLVRSGTFAFLASALWAMLPLVARDCLGGGALTYGFLLGAFGIGAMLSAVASTHLRRHYSTDGIVTGASAAFGLATLATAASPWTALSIAVMLVAGAAWVLSFSTFNVATQTSSPRWVVGRTLAFYQTAAFGGMAAGSWLWGVCADLGGLREALAAAGVLLLASVFVARRFPLHPAATTDLGPLRDRPTEHALEGVDLEDGPIVISIEYRVAPADAAAFVRAAHALGRLRRRDGARRWSLVQDLDDPERYLERYQAVTWLDHLRQAQRATVADREAREAVLKLHQGPGAPRVRHLVARSPDDLPPGRGAPPDPRDTPA